MGAELASKWRHKLGISVRSCVLHPAHLASYLSIISNCGELRLYLACKVELRVMCMMGVPAFYF